MGPAARLAWCRSAIWRSTGRGGGASVARCCAPCAASPALPPRLPAEPPCSRGARRPCSWTCRRSGCMTWRLAPLRPSCDARPRTIWRATPSTRRTRWPRATFVLRFAATAALSASRARWCALRPASATACTDVTRWASRAPHRQAGWERSQWTALLQGWSLCPALRSTRFVTIRPGGLGWPTVASRSRVTEPSAVRFRRAQIGPARLDEGDRRSARSSHRTGHANTQPASRGTNLRLIASGLAWRGLQATGRRRETVRQAAAAWRSAASDDLCVRVPYLATKMYSNMLTL